MSDTNVVQAFVQGPIRKWLRQHAGVVSIRMVSEILLHLGEATQLRPIMVQKGVLSLLVDLNSAVVAQSTTAMTIVKEALANLA